MGEAILALPEASGAVVEVKHMVEVTVAMAEVTLAGMEDFSTGQWLSSFHMIIAPLVHCDLAFENLSSPLHPVVY